MPEETRTPAPADAPASALRAVELFAPAAGADARVLVVVDCRDGSAHALAVRIAAALGAPVAATAPVAGVSETLPIARIRARCQHLGAVGFSHPSVPDADPAPVGPDRIRGGAA